MPGAHSSVQCLQQVPPMLIIGLFPVIGTLRVMKTGGIPLPGKEAMDKMRQMRGFLAGRLGCIIAHLERFCSWGSYPTTPLSRVQSGGHRYSPDMLKRQGLKRQGLKRRGSFRDLLLPVAAAKIRGLIYGWVGILAHRQNFPSKGRS